MFSWGLVTLAHALIKDKFGYITVRCRTPSPLIPSRIFANPFTQ
jgi:hypothetical protein